MQLQLKGKAGIGGLLLVAGLVGLRVASLGESDDPELRRAVQAELLTRMGARTGQDLADIDDVRDVDAETVGDLLARSNPLGIEVHSMRVSRPILAASSSEDVVVQVEFSLPRAEPEREYWLFRHSAVGGWEYRRTTTALSYYLNVM